LSRDARSTVSVFTMNQGRRSPPHSTVADGEKDSASLLAALAARIKVVAVINHALVYMPEGWFSVSEFRKTQSESSPCDCVKL
jgi:hypothetical protein